MKWLLFFVIFTKLQTSIKIGNIRLMNNIDTISMNVKDDISNMEGVLKRLQYISSPKNKSKDNSSLQSLLAGMNGNRNIGSNFRFRENQLETEAKDNISKLSKSSEGSEDADTTDSLDLNLNMSEDPIFNNNESSRDKELERKEGIKNGNLLYNGKRTANVETSEYADFYYEIIKTV